MAREGGRRGGDFLVERSVVVAVAPSSPCGWDHLAPRAGARKRVGSVEPATSPSEVRAVAAAGLTKYFEDRPGAAAEQMRRALNLWARSASRRSQSDLLPRDTAVGVLALIDLDAGDREHAEALLALTGDSFSPTLLDVARARICVGRRDLREASSRLQVVVEVTGDDLTRSQAMLELAMLAVESGDRIGATTMADRARRLLAQSEHAAPLLERTITRVEHRLGFTPAADEIITRREQQVLALLDSALSRREIAAQLYLSHNTVKTYVQRIYRRLDVSSRSEAVMRARQLGWL